MKLHDVPNGSTVKVIGGIKVPPGSPDIKEGEALRFFHTDGMYSLCKNANGETVHLVAWAEVEVLTH